VGIRASDLHPDVLRDILARAVPASGPTPIPIENSPRTKAFVQAGVAIEATRVVVVVPTETKSEANQVGSNSGGWKGKAKRTKNAKMILFHTLWPFHGSLTPFVKHFHGHGGLRVTFTRLGGRVLDDDNLRSSMKATRDGIAALMLADDGDSRFHWCYGQEPGGAIGIRVEIEMFG
jgi:hypothetical protein